MNCPKQPQKGQRLKTTKTKPDSAAGAAYQYESMPRIYRVTVSKPLKVSIISFQHFQHFLIKNWRDWQGDQSFLRLPPHMLLHTTSQLAKSRLQHLYVFVQQKSHKKLLVAENIHLKVKN